MYGSWKFWAIVLLIIFVLICIFFGGGRDHKMVGLNPLINPLEPLDDYIPVAKKRNLFIFNRNRKFGSEGEELTCQVFEEYLEREVDINIRPNFLKNPESGKNLELDIFDSRTKIALEYNGIQHYKFPNSFHKTEQVFYDQVYRDTLKAELTEKEGIILIVVPYTIDENACIEGNRKWKNLPRNEKKLKVREMRKKAISDYLLPILDSVFNPD